VAFCRLQIADITEEQINEYKKTNCCNKTPGDKDRVLNKWMTPLVRWNKNFTKLMKILIDFILFSLFYLH
jgi:hypothetical protein